MLNLHFWFLGKEKVSKRHEEKTAEEVGISCRAGDRLDPNEQELDQYSVFRRMKTTCTPPERWRPLHWLLKQCDHSLELHPARILWSARTWPRGIRRSLCQLIPSRWGLRVPEAITNWMLSRAQVVEKAKVSMEAEVLIYCSLVLLLHQSCHSVSVRACLLLNTLRSRCFRCTWPRYYSGHFQGLSPVAKCNA